MGRHRRDRGRNDSAVAVAFGGRLARRDRRSRWLSHFAIVLIVVAEASFSRPRLAQGGTAQAIGSGIAFGLAAIFTKAMTDSVRGEQRRHSRCESSPIHGSTRWSQPISSAWSCSRTRSIRRAASSRCRSPSALSNLVPIAGGMLAFGERLPADPDRRGDAHRRIRSDDRGEHDARDRRRRKAGKRARAASQNRRPRRLNSLLLHPNCSNLKQFDTAASTLEIQPT